MFKDLLNLHTTVPFQNDIQLAALDFHADLLRVAAFIWIPVTYVLDQLNGTATFRLYNKLSREQFLKLFGKD